VKRITELENCLWRLADAVSNSMKLNEHPELRAALEEAELVLRNRLEIAEAQHRFHSEVGPFKDDLRLFKRQQPPNSDW
jgi:hypothetical protein